MMIREHVLAPAAIEAALERGAARNGDGRYPRSGRSG
jgi:hypothetical protein